MSIATEQKVERLMTRMDDLEMEVAELRQLIDNAKLTPAPKDANGSRPNKK